MQKNKKLEEEMELFLMPVEALKVAGFEDGDRLCINASEGKILIEKVEDEDDLATMISTTNSPFVLVAQIKESKR